MRHAPPLLTASEIGSAYLGRCATNGGPIPWLASTTCSSHDLQHLGLLRRPLEPAPSRWGQTGLTFSNPANIRLAARRSTTPVRGPGVAHARPALRRDASSDGARHPKPVSKCSWGRVDGAVPHQNIKRVCHEFRNLANYRSRFSFAATASTGKINPPRAPKAALHAWLRRVSWARNLRRLSLSAQPRIVDETYSLHCHAAQIVKKRT